MRRAARTGAPGALALALAACGGSESGAPSVPEPPAPALRLVVAGREERGGTIAVAGFRGADSVPAAQLRLAVEPADAATVNADGSVTLRRAGTLALVATFADGREARTTRTIATPPLLVLDLVVGGNRDVYRVALDGGDLLRLTTQPGEDAAPTAAAGTVVFASYRTGNSDLYAVPVDGGTERRLTTTPEAELEPALAADGRRLAFVRPSRGVGRVWVADSVAAGARLLTPELPGGAPEASPTWGPPSGGGGRLAFTTTAGGQADVALAAVDPLPTTPSLLAASSPMADVEPAWSADGARLAFVSTREGGEPALWVADAAGGGPATRLTARGTSAAQPGWLADGRIVLVVRSAATGGNAAVVWLDPAAPAVVHPIALPGESPGHPRPVR